MDLSDNHDHNHKHHDHHHPSGKSDHSDRNKSHHDHGHGHDHHHNHGILGHHHHGASQNIKIAFFLNLGFSLLEIVGGIWTGSVAILADAIHDLGDAMALALAWFFEKMSTKKSNAKYSYGYRRLSLLSAVITCSILVVGSAIVIAKAIPRLMHPVTPKLDGMLAFAIIGVLVNGFAAWKLIKGNTLNEKVASWHLIEDVFGWVTVLIGTIVMMFFDVPIVDPLLSIFFTIYILWNVLKNLKMITGLFLQAVPEDVNVDDMRNKIEHLDGVLGTHDMHLWSLDGESHVLTMHVVISSQVNLEDSLSIKNKIRDVVQNAGRFHVTIEMERQDEECPDMNCVQ